MCNGNTTRDIDTCLKERHLEKGMRVQYHLVDYFTPPKPVPPLEQDIPKEQRERNMKKFNEARVTINELIEWSVAITYVFCTILHYLEG